MTPTKKPLVKYRSDLPKGQALIPLTDRRLTFTTTAAYAHLELATFEGERSILDSHVQLLLDEHRAGRFDWQLVTLVTATHDSTTYRLNGQHTAWMRVNLPPNSPDPLVRHLHYSVKSEEELRSLYSIIDRNKSRSVSHVLKVMAGGHDDLDGIWPSLLSLYAAGFRLWRDERRDRASRVGPEETLNGLLEHRDTLSKLASFYQDDNAKKRLFKKVGVIAALFATFDRSPTESLNFWPSVATGLGLSEETDPRYQLREYLSTIRVQTVGNEDIFRICINGWNKWRNGEKCLSSLRTTEERKRVK